VEFQILGDHHRNILHLFERECSVQRRHQKIIEETPSPLLTPALRDEMGAAAVAAARAVGYASAGTVEFIVDPDTKQFFFLEMNTRLQVEHPITELVTGIDLAQWQMRIASGERLTFSQADLRQRGHAIECRLYAEDPADNFIPATGKLLRFIEPRGPGVRVDSGVTTGDEITIHYDPLIAKLIVHAEDRLSAIRKMGAALRETVLLGVTTNWQFLQDVLAHPEFEERRADTTWVERTFEGWQHPQCELPPEVLVAAALTQFHNTGESGSPPDNASLSDPYSPWRAGNAFRLGEG
jgi:acetyl/propionyl-CoA carboxylase alpha subunit